MNAETIPTPRSEAKSLFNIWCGASYQWDALSLIEQQRWHILSEVINDATCQLERENIALKESLRLKTAELEAWESTAKLVSKLPCGHPNDCAYDKNANGRWANIGCVWCERDALRAALVNLPAAFEQHIKAAMKAGEITSHTDSLYLKQILYGVIELAVPDWGKE